jgi:hypothetical protein
LARGLGGQEAPDLSAGARDHNAVTHAHESGTPGLGYNAPGRHASSLV